MDDNMTKIEASTTSMNDKTSQLAEKLGGVGSSVSRSRHKLDTVDGKLGKTAKSMGGLKTTVEGSLSSTNQIVGEFGTIDTAIRAMDSNLRELVGLMGASAPLTKAFAQNKTVKSVAGGDGHRYGIPNIAAGSSVMSVVLPMIKTMQNGGSIAARKDSAVASNPVIGMALNKQVPNGTNVGANIVPYDGFYGMPGPAYFVNTPVNGF
jgi:hypothetical protein